MSASNVAWKSGDANTLLVSGSMGDHAASSWAPFSRAHTARLSSNVAWESGDAVSGADA